MVSINIKADNKLYIRKAIVPWPIQVGLRVKFLSNFHFKTYNLDFSKDLHFFKNSHIS
jgi:hypothetical protein